MKYSAARLEVGRVDWTSYRAPKHGGPGIPEIFLKLFEAGSADEAAGYSLEQRFEVQAMVYEVALPAVDVIVAAYADSPPLWLEMELLDVLHNIVLGEPHRSEVEAGNHLLIEQCVDRARRGMWVLYSRLSKHNYEFLLDILAELDDDRSRVEAFRRSCSDRYR